MVDKETIYFPCKCSLYCTYNESKKEVQKITRRVPRKTVKTTARCKGAVLFLCSSLFLPRDPPMKLMSFVIFEKFRRIPEEKMSPLSGKNILGRIDWKNGIAFSSFSATWIGFSFQWRRTEIAGGWGRAPRLSQVCKSFRLEPKTRVGKVGEQSNLKWLEMLWKKIGDADYFMLMPRSILTNQCLFSLLEHKCY